MANNPLSAVRGAALMTIAVVAVGCGSRCGRAGAGPEDARTTTGGGEVTSKQGYEPKILTSATGATRLLVSRDGAVAAAELGGTWREDVFLAHQDEVPPVLRVIDVAADEVRTTVSGWALGAPDGDGDVVYLEERDEEYDYHLRSTARPDLVERVEHPDGFWLPKAALGDGETTVLVMRSAAPGRSWTDTATRGERLWIAVIDRASLRVTASAIITAATWARRGHRLGAGVALNPKRPELYVVSMPDPMGDGAWELVAIGLDDMKQRWTARLPTLAEVEVVPLPEPKRDDGRVAPPAVTPRPTVVDPASERSRHNTLIEVTSDGRTIVATHGLWLRGSMSTDVAHVVEASTGKVVRSVMGAIVGAPRISQLVAAPASSDIALLHVLTDRDGGSAFLGVSAFTPESAKVAPVYDVSTSALGAAYEKVKLLDPGAIALTAASLLIAPERGADVGDDSTTSSQWHRDDRPRVQAMEQYMRSTGM